ncbi:unnamed protein product [Sphagnum jensenii]
MTYTPNPSDPTNPTLAILAGTAQAEFQAIKLYVKDLLSKQNGRRNRLLNGAFRIGSNGIIGTDSSTAVGGNSYYQTQYFENITIQGWSAQGYTYFDQWVYEITQNSYTGSQTASAYIQPSLGKTASFNPSGTATIVGTIVGTTTVGTQTTIGTWTVGTNSYQQGLEGAFFQNNAGVATAQLYQSIEAVTCQDMTTGTTLTLSGNISNSDTVNVSITPFFEAASSIDNFATLTTVGTGTAIGGLSQGTLTAFEQQIVLTAGATNGLVCGFDCSNAGTGSFTVGFSNIQLEVNSFPTPFDSVPLAVELPECQRFTLLVNQNFLIPPVSSGFDVNFAYPITMRATPTVQDLGSTSLTYHTVGTRFVYYTSSNTTTASLNGNVNCILLARF